MGQAWERARNKILANPDLQRTVNEYRSAFAQTTVALAGIGVGLVLLVVGTVGVALTGSMAFNRLPQGRRDGISRLVDRTSQLQRDILRHLTREEFEAYFGHQVWRANR